MLVVEALVGFLEQPVERFDRSAADFLDRRLELAPLFPLDVEHVAGGVDPAPVAIDAGEDGGAPLPAVAAERSEHPDRVHLGRRNIAATACARRAQPETGARAAHADACSHRSQ